MVRPHPLRYHHSDCQVFLGLDEADAQRQNLDVYKESFQVPYIAATCAFYKAESEAFVAANSVSDYLKKAEDRLKEEDDRVTLLLHNSTRKEVSTRSSAPDTHTRLGQGKVRACFDSGARRDDVGRVPSAARGRPFGWRVAACSCVRISS